MFGCLRKTVHATAAAVEGGSPRLLWGEQSPFSKSRGAMVIGNQDVVGRSRSYSVTMIRPRPLGLTVPSSLIARANQVIDGTPRVHNPCGS
jgi:hypothetical protein